MSGEMDLNAILSQENPDGDVFVGATAPDDTTTTTVTEQPTPEPVTQDQQQEQHGTTTTTEEANPFQDGSAQWKAFERIRETERERAEAIATQRAMEAAQQRDQQWQQWFAQQQRQQAPAEAKPDPIIDPEGYEQYLMRQIGGRYDQQMQTMGMQMAQMAYQRSMDTAQAVYTSQGKDWNALYQSVNEFAKTFPGIVKDIQSSDNPGLALIQLGERLQAQQQAQSTATAPAITDAVRQQVLADEAKRLAAAGAPPQIQVPRGVGSGPSGAGYSDAAPPPSEYVNLAQSDPAAWAKIKANILSQ